MSMPSGAHLSPDSSSPTLVVTCNGFEGTFIVASQLVVCHCARCNSDPMRAMTAMDFERHAGMATSRKWKYTLRVMNTDRSSVPLGLWMYANNVTPKFVRTPRSARVKYAANEMGPLNDDDDDDDDQAGSRPTGGVAGAHAGQYHTPLNPAGLGGSSSKAEGAFKTESASAPRVPGQRGRPRLSGSAPAAADKAPGSRRRLGPGSPRAAAALAAALARHPLPEAAREDARDRDEEARDEAVFGHRGTPTSSRIGGVAGEDEGGAAPAASASADAPGRRRRRKAGPVRSTPDAYQPDSPGPAATSARAGKRSRLGDEAPLLERHERVRRRPAWVQSAIDPGDALQALAEGAGRGRGRGRGAGADAGADSETEEDEALAYRRARRERASSPRGATSPRWAGDLSSLPKGGGMGPRHLPGIGPAVGKGSAAPPPSAALPAAAAAPSWPQVLDWAALDGGQLQMRVRCGAVEYRGVLSAVLHAAGGVPGPAPQALQPPPQPPPQPQPLEAAAWSSPLPRWAGGAPGPALLPPPLAAAELARAVEMGRAAELSRAASGPRLALGGVELRAGNGPAPAQEPPSPLAGAAGGGRGGRGRGRGRGRGGGRWSSDPYGPRAVAEPKASAESGASSGREPPARAPAAAAALLLGVREGAAAAAAQDADAEAEDREEADSPALSPRRAAPDGRAAQRDAMHRAKAEQFDRMEVEGPEPGAVCALCRLAGEPAIPSRLKGADGRCLRALGPLVLVRPTPINAAWVHEQCLSWSPEVAERPPGADRTGAEAAAVRRGRLIKCAACHQRGATLGCKTRCAASLHLHCARAGGALLQVEPYMVVCAKHGPQFAGKLARGVGGGGEDGEGGRGGRDDGDLHEGVVAWRNARHQGEEAQGGTPRGAGRGGGGHAAWGASGGGPGAAERRAKAEAEEEEDTSLASSDSEHVEADVKVDRWAVGGLDRLLHAALIGPGGRA